MPLGLSAAPRPWPRAYSRGGLRDDAVFVPGMSVCVESFIGHEDGGEGVKLEEQVLITGTGIERLSVYGYDERLSA